MKPLMVDLYCGLGGWAEAALAVGYRVIGFDIERHQYGEHRYPAQLVIQDVLTLHGSQFRDAALIVASPPCQEYSYMAMPWKRAKAKATAIRADETGAELARLNSLFDACFRIQREASEAAGRHIPLIVENVKGAQPWVGRARWSFGSFYLWGDVPALMQPTFKGAKVPGFRFDGSGGSFQSASVSGLKEVGPKWDASTKSGAHGMKRWTNPDEGFKQRGSGRDWWDKALDERRKEATAIKNDGIKSANDGLGGYGGNLGWNNTPMRRGNSKSSSRKAASALIAKIPEPLARHIACTFYPQASHAEKITASC